MSNRYDQQMEVTELESIRDSIRRLRQDLEVLRDAEEAHHEAANTSTSAIPSRERVTPSKNYKLEE